MQLRVALEAQLPRSPDLRVDVVPLVLQGLVVAAVAPLLQLPLMARLVELADFRVEAVVEVAHVLMLRLALAVQEAVELSS
jgi:hypothetical protein